MPPPPPTRGIECVSRADDEAHSSDKKCATTAICECAVITGLGFQKEMTHPSDDVEETMNTPIYILCVYKHLPRGLTCVM